MITELMFRPTVPPGALLADDFEFIELMNTGRRRLH